VSAVARWNTLAGGDLTISGGVMLALGVLPGHPGLPCPLRALTGVPCPLCGMTTSVEATLHGQLGTALRANPAGVAAVVVAIALLVVRPARVRIPTAGLYATIASMWVFELWRFALI
jgi:Protein of unknown function (DUF2752)